MPRVCLFAQICYDLNSEATNAEETKVINQWDDVGVMIRNDSIVN